ncbi:thiamine phosphate synthase [Crenobacter caeni]|uniref:Thiamine-phosphate synthase n=1 Tax=Crenobacter caeni TaxID=2705474 RepID=A0A6B2KS45_9NEIS|nr:thiamine phosphate synthase [Crenobacter caeni]NDV13065.1 thiamine phosphate synthase [Crenobacter caeni]
MSAPDYRVYLVLDPGQCGGLEGMLRVSEAAIAGGAGVVQLRAPDWKKRDWLAAARALKTLCHARGARLLVNDHLDVALAIGADGVHVGQADLPAGVVRSLLGPDAIVGLSVSNAAELAAAELAAVDYLGVGPVFATLSKPDAAPPVGLAGLASLVSAVGKPCVAIGGISLDNAASVAATGVAGVAVIGALCRAADPAAAARALLNHFREKP